MLCHVVVTTSNMSVLMCDYTDLQLPDESAPDLRQRRGDVIHVGGGRHEVRHLDVVGVLGQLVGHHDEGGDAHAEADELQLVLPRLLHHQILHKGASIYDVRTKGGRGG